MRTSTNSWRKILTAGAVGLAITVGGTVFSIDETQAQRGPPDWSGNDYWMPGWMRHRMWRHSRDPDMRARRERHWTFMHGGIPAAYEAARSNINVDKDAIATGGKIYAANCASCHGKTGDGDGEAGKSLTPSPALLSFLIERPISVDPYLLWTISDGGEQFGTDMPGFTDKLSRDEIWKVVAYMRAGFPKVEDAK